MIVHVKVNIQLKFQSDMQDSWSKALEIRLRNMRRKKCSKNTGMTFNRPKVNEKKKNSVHASSVTPGKLLDDKTFQRHKLALAKEAKKGTKNRDSVKILMRETSSNRRRWIVTEHPSVSEVREEFPNIFDFGIVSYHYQIYIFLYYVYPICR